MWLSLACVERFPDSLLGKNEDYRLPREAVGAPSLETFKISFDRALI